jgi:hypothetical protein
VNQYRGPEKIRPTSTSQHSDKLQAEWTKAAADALIAVFKPMVQENPNLLVKSLQPHHFERLAIDCVDAYVTTRRRQELAEELRVGVPDDPLGDLYRG